MTTPPESPTPPRPWLLARTEALLVAGGLLAIVASVLGLAGRAWWGLELFSHFRPQYALALVVAAIGLALLRRPRAAAVFLVAAVANAAFVAPLFVGAPAPPDPGAPIRRLLLANVHTANPRHDLVLDLVRETDPDLLVLLEVDEAWLDALAPLAADLPHRIARPRSDNFGIALFSRRPIRAHEVVSFGGGGIPSIIASFGAGGGGDDPFTLIATHPLPPTSRAGAERRNAHLGALAAHVRTLDGEVIVLGDLNATPWSPHFRRLLRESGLRDSTRGFGLQPTWPTRLLPLRIPIDHCLVTDGLTILDRRVGPAVGSDHFPLIVDVQP